jgi:hypothetical protein
MFVVFVNMELTYQVCIVMSCSAASRFRYEATVNVTRSPHCKSILLWVIEIMDK